MKRAILLLALLMMACAPEPAMESSKEVVLDLYVMSQCPYGVQAENALAPVFEKLGSAVDFNIHYIGSGSKGSFKSLHGEPEVKGNTVQLCAKKVAPDKYFNYILCMNENPSTIPDNWQDCAEKLNISVEPLKSCYEGDEGAALLEASFKKSEGVGASPTYKINGVEHTGKRDPVSLMTFLCSKFKEQPEVCKDVPKPINFTITVLNDASCKECDSSVLEQKLEQFFMGAKIVKVNLNDTAASDLIEKYSLERIPAFIFEDKVNLTPEWSDPKLQELFDDNFKLKDEVTGAVRFIDPEKQKEFEAALEEAKKKALDKLGVNYDEKPQIDFFLMSYCPYGNQAEEAIKVAFDVLKDKVEFNPRYIIYKNYKNNDANYCVDGYCSMHGTQELNQNVRELCVKKLYGMQSWFDFVVEMNKECNYQNADTCWKPVAEKLKYNTKNIELCEKNNGPDIIKEEYDVNVLLGVTGSPTVLVEGEPYGGSRSGSGFTKALCDKLEDKPDVCNDLPKDEPVATPTGGCG